MHQVEIEPREMSQVKLVLEQKRNVSQFSGLINIFWGLIAAKCVLSEWAVQYFNWPIFSIYIWMPTLLFGIIGTWVYAGFTLKKIHHRPLTGQFVSAIWGGSLMALALIGIGGWGLGKISLYVLPSIFSIVIGMGFFIHSVIDNRFVFKLSAYGWWIGSVWLFYQSNLNTLAWFAFMIVLFHVLPAAWLYLNNSIRKTS